MSPDDPTATSSALSNAHTYLTIIELTTQSLPIESESAGSADIVDKIRVIINALSDGEARSISDDHILDSRTLSTVQWLVKCCKSECEQKLT
jgi:hypothetical protein